MAADGKQLEALVAFVEKTLTPHGLTVSTNEHVFNDESVQIAEFEDGRGGSGCELSQNASEMGVQ